MATMGGGGWKPRCYGTTESGRILRRAGRTYENAADTTVRRCSRSCSYTASVSPITASGENSRAASCLLFAPIRARSDGFARSLSSASARATASFTGTRRPLCSCWTTSRQPGASVATIGSPLAAASMRARGTPSRYEGRQAMELLANTSGMSDRNPHHSTSPDAFQSRNSRSPIAEGFPASRPPISANRATTPRRRRSPAALTNSPIPLSQSMRAGSATIGGASRDASGRKGLMSTPLPLITKVAAWDAIRLCTNSARSSGFWKMVALFGWASASL